MKQPCFFKRPKLTTHNSPLTIFVLYDWHSNSRHGGGQHFGHYIFAAGHQNLEDKIGRRHLAADVHLRYYIGHHVAGVRHHFKRHSHYLYQQPCVDLLTHYAVF